MTTAQSDDEFLDITESIAIRSDTPFYGSVLDLEDYKRIAKECIIAIEGSTNIRQVVLETWLLVDYAIRELLSNLWELKQFNSEDEDFDLRYELLPGFKYCIRLLEKVLSIQRSLEEDPERHEVKIPVGFIFFFKKNYPTEFERFLHIEQDYYQKYHPQLAKPGPNVFVFTKANTSVKASSRPRYCVNKSWVKVCSNLDDTWFRLAHKLNKARNVAAHSYDANKILSAFGYAGINAADKTKRECIEMLTKLLGIALKPAGNTSNG